MSTCVYGVLSELCQCEVESVFVCPIAKSIMMFTEVWGDNIIGSNVFSCNTFSTGIIFVVTS